MMGGSYGFDIGMMNFLRDEEELMRLMEEEGDIIEEEEIVEAGDEAFDIVVGGRPRATSGGVSLNQLKSVMFASIATAYSEWAYYRKQNSDLVTKTFVSMPNSPEDFKNKTQMAYKRIKEHHEIIEVWKDWGQSTPLKTIGAVGYVGNRIEELGKPFVVSACRTPTLEFASKFSAEVDLHSTKTLKEIALETGNVELYTRACRMERGGEFGVQTSVIMDLIEKAINLAIMLEVLGLSLQGAGALGIGSVAGAEVGVVAEIAGGIADTLGAIIGVAGFLAEYAVTSYYDMWNYQYNNQMMGTNPVTGALLKFYNGNFDDAFDDTMFIEGEIKYNIAKGYLSYLSPRVSTLLNGMLSVGGALVMQKQIIKRAEKFAEHGVSLKMTLGPHNIIMNAIDILENFENLVPKVQSKAFLLAGASYKACSEGYDVFLKHNKGFIKEFYDTGFNISKSSRVISKYVRSKVTMEYAQNVSDLFSSITSFLQRSDDQIRYSSYIAAILKSDLSSEQKNLGSKVLAFMSRANKSFLEEDALESDLFESFILDFKQELKMVGNDLKRQLEKESSHTAKKEAVKKYFENRGLKGITDEQVTSIVNYIENDAEEDLINTIGKSYGGFIKEHIGLSKIDVNYMNNIGALFNVTFDVDKLDNALNKGGFLFKQYRAFINNLELKNPKEFIASISQYGAGYLEKVHKLSLQSDSLVNTIKNSISKDVDAILSKGDDIRDFRIYKDEIKNELGIDDIDEFIDCLENKWNEAKEKLKSNIASDLDSLSLNKGTKKYDKELNNFAKKYGIDATLVNGWIDSGLDANYIVDELINVKLDDNLKKQAIHEVLLESTLKDIKNNHTDRIQRVFGENSAVESLHNRLQHISKSVSKLKNDILNSGYGFNTSYVIQGILKNSEPSTRVLKNVLTKEQIDFIKSNVSKLNNLSNDELREILKNARFGKWEHIEQSMVAKFKNDGENIVSALKMIHNANEEYVKLKQSNAILSLKQIFGNNEKMITKIVNRIGYLSQSNMYKIIREGVDQGLTKNEILSNLTERIDKIADLSVNNILINNMKNNLDDKAKQWLSSITKIDDEKLLNKIYSDMKDTLNKGGTENDIKNVLKSHLKSEVEQGIDDAIRINKKLSVSEGDLIKRFHDGEKLLDDNIWNAIGEVKLEGYIKYGYLSSNLFNAVNDWGLKSGLKISDVNEIIDDLTEYIVQGNLFTKWGDLTEEGKEYFENTLKNKLQSRNFTDEQIHLITNGLKEILETNCTAKNRFNHSNVLNLLKEEIAKKVGSKEVMNHLDDLNDFLSIEQFFKNKVDLREIINKIGNGEDVIDDLIKMGFDKKQASHIVNIICDNISEPLDNLPKILETELLPQEHAIVDNIINHNKRTISQIIDDFKSEITPLIDNIDDEEEILNLLNALDLFKKSKGFNQFKQLHMRGAGFKISAGVPNNISSNQKIAKLIYNHFGFDGLKPYLRQGYVKGMQEALENSIISDLGLCDKYMGELISVQHLLDVSKIADPRAKINTATNLLKPYLGSNAKKIGQKLALDLYADSNEFKKEVLDIINNKKNTFNAPTNNLEDILDTIYDLTVNDAEEKFLKRTLKDLTSKYGNRDLDDKYIKIFLNNEGEEVLTLIKSLRDNDNLKAKLSSGQGKVSVNSNASAGSKLSAEDEISAELSIDDDISAESKLSAGGGSPINEYEENLVNKVGRLKLPEPTPTYSNTVLWFASDVGKINASLSHLSASDKIISHLNNGVHSTYHLLNNNPLTEHLPTILQALTLSNASIRLRFNNPFVKDNEDKAEKIFNHLKTKKSINDLIIKPLMDDKKLTDEEFFEEYLFKGFIHRINNLTEEELNIIKKELTPEEFEGLQELRKEGGRLPKILFNLPVKAYWKTTPEQDFLSAYKQMKKACNEAINDLEQSHIKLERDELLNSYTNKYSKYLNDDIDYDLLAQYKNMDKQDIIRDLDNNIKANLPASICNNDIKQYAVLRKVVEDLEDELLDELISKVSSGTSGKKAIVEYINQKVDNDLQAKMPAIKKEIENTIKQNNGKIGRILESTKIMSRYDEEIVSNIVKSTPQQIEKRINSLEAKIKNSTITEKEIEEYKALGITKVIIDDCVSIGNPRLWKTMLHISTKADKSVYKALETLKHHHLGTLFGVHERNMLLSNKLENIGKLLIGTALVGQFAWGMVNTYINELETVPGGQNLILLSNLSMRLAYSPLTWGLVTPMTYASMRLLGKTARALPIYQHNIIKEIDIIYNPYSASPKNRLLLSQEQISSSFRNTISNIFMNYGSFLFSSNPLLVDVAGGMNTLTGALSSISLLLSETRSIRGKVYEGIAQKVSLDILQLEKKLRQINLEIAHKSAILDYRKKQGVDITDLEEELNRLERRKESLVEEINNKEHVKLNALTLGTRSAPSVLLRVGSIGLYSALPTLYSSYLWENYVYEYGNDPTNPGNPHVYTKLRLYYFDADYYVQEIIGEEVADYYMFTKDEVLKMMILEGAKVKSLESIDKYDVATRYLNRVINAYLLKKDNPGELQHSKDLYELLTGNNLEDDSLEDAFVKWENQLAFMSRLYHVAFDDTIMNNDKSGLGLSAKSRIEKAIYNAGFDGHQTFVIVNKDKPLQEVEISSNNEAIEDNLRVIELEDNEIKLINELLKDKEGVDIRNQDDDSIIVEFEDMNDEGTNDEIDGVSSLKSKVEQTKPFGFLKFI